MHRPAPPLSLPPSTRLTPQRRAVIEAVARTNAPFTPLELYERLGRSSPGLGLATVYRTLELLRRVGSIRRLAGADAYVRCHPGHHHHLVCVECGSVEETELCAAPPPDELERRHGFAAARHELDIYGTCARCRAA